MTDQPADLRYAASPVERRSPRILPTPGPSSMCRAWRSIYVALFFYCVLQVVLAAYTIPELLFT
jgi:hypothetical protein